jgi:hypothetical protein
MPGAGGPLAFLIFIDADVRLKPEALRRMVPSCSKVERQFFCSALGALAIFVPVS